jgi:Flp pilus assembly protein TadD
MKTRFLWSILAVLFGTGSIHIATAAPPDPADQFLEAYFLIQEADASERQSAWNKAHEQFTKALDRLNTIRALNPNWNPHIVEFRIRHCNEHIDQLKPRLTSVVPPPASSVPATTPAAPPAAIPVLELPTPPADVPPPAPPAGADPEAEARQNRLETELAAARAQIKELESQRAKLQTDLQAELAKTPPEASNPQVEQLLDQNRNLAAQVAKLQTELVAMRDAAPPPTPAADNQETIRLRAELQQARAETEQARRDLEQERVNVATLRQELADTKTELSVLRASYEQVVAMLNEANRNLSSLHASKEMDDKIILQLRKENALLRVIADSRAVSGRRASVPITPKRPAHQPPATEESKKDKLVATVTAPVPSPAASTASSAPAASTPAAPVPPPPDIQPPVPGELNPAKLPEWLEAARGAYATNDLSAATANWELALTVEPTNKTALSGLATARYRQQQLDAASALATRWIVQDPHNSKAYALQGIIHLRKKEIDAAFDKLTRATALDPQNAEAHNYLGICLSARDQAPAAEQSILKAIAISPQYADAHFNLAVLYIKSNPPRYQQAQAHYQFALRAGAAPDKRLEALLAKGISTEPKPAP